MPLFPPPAVLSPQTSLELSNMSHGLQFTNAGPRKFTGVKTHLQNLVRNVWVAGANKNTALYAGFGSGGSQNAGIVFSGYATSAVSERYNGNTWTTTNALVTAKYYVAGVGTSMAAACLGGYTGAANTGQVEVFNGSTWSNSAGGNLITVRRSLSGTGTRLSAVVAGGWTTVASNVTETWNGEYAVNTNTLPGARAGGAMCGTGFNAMYTTGSTSDNSTGSDNRVWLFNGTNWTVTTINFLTARTYANISGTLDGALLSGGLNSGGTVEGSAEIWHHESRSFKATTSSLVARQSSYGFGTLGAAVSVAGHNGTATVASTEKWYGEQPYKISVYAIGTAVEKIDTSDLSNTDATPFGWMSEACDVQVDLLPDPNSGVTADQRVDVVDLDRLDFTEGVWARGGNINTARTTLAAFGTRKASVITGGWVAAASLVTEKYNGSSWAASANLNTARYRNAAAGMSSAGLTMSGLTAASTTTATCEKFNGTSWTATTSVNTARQGMAGAGTMNAAVTMSGADGTPTGSAICETFDGTTWTSLGSISSARYQLAGAGTKFAAITANGWLTGAGAACAFSQKFNGSIFQSTANTNNTRYLVGGSGSQNNAIVVGGANNYKYTERFNGDSWRHCSDMITGKTGPACSGPGQSSISCGGDVSGVNSSETEEYSTQTVMPFSGTWGKLFYDI